MESRDQEHPGDRDSGSAGCKSGLVGGLCVGEEPGARAAAEVSSS